MPVTSVEVTVQANATGWVNTGLVLPPGYGFTFTAQGSIGSTDAVSWGTVGVPVYSYPEGRYLIGGTWPQTSTYNPSACDPPPNPGAVAPDNYPQCLLFLVSATNPGSNVAPTGKSIRGDRAGIVEPGDSRIPTGGGTVWAWYNDGTIPAGFADNSGFFTVTLALQSPTTLPVPPTFNPVQIRVFNPQNWQPGRVVRQVVSFEWRITVEDGYADAMLIVPGQYPPTGVTNGTRIELWAPDDQGVSQLQYRGYVWRIQPIRDGGEPWRTEITIYGIWHYIGMQLVRQRYIWPTSTMYASGKDLSQAFAEIVGKWGITQILGYPFIANVCTLILDTGQYITAYDSWNHTLASVAQDFINLAGAIVVTGGDVSTNPEDANYLRDRIFLRPCDPLPTPTAPAALVLQLPSAGVLMYMGDTDQRRQINSVILEGGAPAYANLLANAVQNNTGFEYPIFNSNTASGGTQNNLIADPGFEQKDPGTGIPSDQGVWTDLNGAKLNGGGAAASLKTGGLKEGSTDSGDWMALADNNAGNPAPYPGSNTGSSSSPETIQQVITASFATGDTYVLQTRLRTVHETLGTYLGNTVGSVAQLDIFWYHGVYPSGTLLQTNTAVYTYNSQYLNTNQLQLDDNWRTFNVIGVAPATADHVIVRLTANYVQGAGSNSDGILTDNWAFYDGTIAYQAGWEIAGDTASPVVWNYEEPCPLGSGSYSLRIANTSNSDPISLRPLNAAKFNTVSAPSLLVSFWGKSPTVFTSGFSGTPEIQLQLFCYNSAGNGVNLNSLSVTPGNGGTDVSNKSHGEAVTRWYEGGMPDPITEWTQYYFYMSTDDPTMIAANLDISIRTQGEFLIDNVMVMDAGADLANWIESNQYEKITNAADTTLTPYYAQSMLPSLSAIQASPQTYGLLPQVVSTSTITNDTDAKGFLAYYFYDNALPTRRPLVKIGGRGITTMPGQYVGGIGPDAQYVFPNGPEIVQEIEGTYDSGKLEITLFAGAYRETEIRREREIAAQIALQQTGFGRPEASVAATTANVGTGSSTSGLSVGGTFRGTWSSAATYQTGDEVVYSTSYPSLFAALQMSTNEDPTTTSGFWQEVVAAIGIDRTTVP